jgi:hypothetical protein
MGKKYYTSLDTGEIVEIGQRVADLPDIWCATKAEWDVSAHADWLVVEVLDVSFREDHIWVAVLIEEPEEE